MFENDGIHVRRLPGFGKGELIKIDPNTIDVHNMPKFCCEIINKDNLDANLKNKKATVYSYDREKKHKTDICGQITRNVNIETKIEERATNDGVFYCPNELCQKAYFRYSAYQNHKDDRKKCAIKMPKQSTKDYAVEQYIAKNGISNEYQSMSFKETRDIIFQKGRLPAIDPFFLTLMKSDPAKYCENLCRGHALPMKKSVKRHPKKVTEYLEALFIFGEKNPSKKKKPAEVAKEMMQEAEFTRDDWLTETQIKSYFNRLASKKLFQLKPDEAPSQVQTEITANLQNAVDQMVLTEHIQTSLEEGAMPDELCPIICEGIDFCALAESIKSSKSVQESKMGEIPQKKIKNALHAIGIDDFEGGKATKKKMALMVQQYVEEKCGCTSI